MTHAYRDESTEVYPGPCTDTCPEPTEIVCIKTNKVFDFVYQCESRDECFDVPDDCQDATTVTCSIDTARTTCDEVGTRTPVPNGNGLYTVTLLIRVYATVTVSTPNGRSCPIEVVLPIVKAVNLCAPAGTTVQCDVTALCTCALTKVNACTQVCCAFQLCIVISAVALVHLLVPTFGFCVPASAAERCDPLCPPPAPPHCSSLPLTTSTTGSISSSSAGFTSTSRTSTSTSTSSLSSSSSTVADS